MPMNQTEGDERWQDTKSTNSGNQSERTSSWAIKLMYASFHTGAQSNMAGVDSSRDSIELTPGGGKYTSDALIQTLQRGSGRSQMTSATGAAKATTITAYSQFVLS